MTIGVESLNERLLRQTMEEQADDQVEKYGGSIPMYATSFLSSSQIEKLLSAQSDAISLSNADAATKTGSLRTHQKPTTHKAEKKGGVEEQSNYIENTGDGTSNVDEGQDISGAGGGGEMSGEDLLAWLEESLFDFINDLMSMEDEIMVLNEDGYYEIDEQVLEDYYRKVTSFCAARLLFALVFDTRVQCQQLIYETYNPKDPDNTNDMEQNAENKPLSFMESVAKGNEMYQGVMTEFMTQLIQRCMTENMKTYNDRAADYKAETEEWHDYLPFCGDTEWYLDKMKEETEDFQNAMKSMMNDLREVLRAISSVFGPLNSGFMKSLDGIEDKIDAIIPEIPDYDEVSGGIPAWVDIIGFFAGDALLYSAIRLVLGECGVGNPEYDGEYLDVNQIRNAFSDVRKDLGGVLSALSIRLQCLTTLEDAKAQIYEGFNNRKFVENRTSLLAQALEAESQHQLALFDRLTETVISTAKLRNQVVYINKQIQKSQKPLTRLLTTAASALQVVAVVLVVLGIIFSWTGIGAVIAMIGVALAAALATYGAAKYSNDVIKDAYQPDENEFVENKEKAEAENKRNKTLLELQNAQDDIMNDLNNSTLLNKTNDGYLSMEYGLVADKYRQFISQQNLMRILFEIQEIQQSLQQAIRATYTGISGPKRNFMLSNVLEMQLGQGRSDFNRLVANVKDCAEAYNMEYQQEEQVYNAGITLAWSCGFAVVGGAIGGGIGGGLGIQIGVALGQAIGNVIGQLGANYGWWGKGGSYGVEFNPDKGNLKQIGKKAGTLAEKVEFEETQIYAEALEDGTCNAGDGYEAVDSHKMASLQSRLLSMGNVRSLIAAVSQLTSQLKSMITASYGNVTVEEADVLTPAMKAQFEASIKVFSYVKDAVQEHVVVQNRARDAEIEVGKSWAKFALNVATAIVGAGVGLGTTSTAFTNLIPALIGIENSLVDLISGIIHSRPEYGELADQTKNFDEKKVEAKNEGKRLEERGAEERTMSEIDDQSNSLGFDQGMLETVGGGHMSVNNGELSLANAKLRSLMRVAEMIKEAQKTQAKVMADIIAVNTGIMEPESNLFDNMTNNYKAMMTEILQSKFAALQAYAQRNNQIADQERSMWQSVASLVMQAAITALSQSIANNQEDAGKIMERGQNSPTGNSTQETQDLADLQSSFKDMTLANMALQVLQPWVESMVGAIYDDAAHSEDTSKTEKQISSRQSALLADKNAEGLAALDAMEAAEVEANFELGKIDLRVEAQQVDARLNEEVGQSTQSAAKSLPNIIKQGIDLASDDNPIDQLIKFNQLRDGLMDMQVHTEDAIFNPEASSQYQSALTDLQDAIAKYNEDPNQQNTAGLQLAYADFISTLADIMPQLNNIMASLQEMQDKADQLSEQRTQILGEEPTAPTPEELEADQGLVSNTELQTRIADLRHKIDRLQAIIAQVQDPTTKPEEIPAMLDELATLSTEVQTAQSSIQSGFENAQVLTDAAQACVSQNISEALLAQLNAKVKDKTGDRRIEELSPEELRSLYQDLREPQFSQAVILRNAARTLQNSLQKLLNGTQLTASEHALAAEALATLQGSSELSQEDRNLLEYAKTALNAEGEISDDTRIGVNGTLARLGSIQGESQQKIQNFNRLIGQIRGLLKDKHGMSDAEIDTFLAVGLDTPMPESVIAPSAAATAPAEPAAAVTTAPAQPQMDSNTQALLARAQSIANSTPIIETDGSLNINGQIVSSQEVDQLIDRLQGIDQAQLNSSQKTEVTNALTILHQAQETEVTVNPGTEPVATTGALAASEAPAVMVAVNDETEEEDEQLEDLLEDLFKALGNLEGAFDAAAKATSGSQLALLDEMSRETARETTSGVAA